MTIIIVTVVVMNHLFLENMASFEALKPELLTTKSQFFAKDNHRRHYPATRDKDDTENRAGS